MIWRYRADDLAQVLDVWYRASLVGHPFLDDSFLAGERHTIERRYLPQAEVWVCERAGTVVGFIALLGSEVGGLFVDPDWQRQGVGHALLDQAAGLHPGLSVDVFAENTQGRRFYARYGFREVDRHRHPATGRLQLRLVHGADLDRADPPPGAP